MRKNVDEKKTTKTFRATENTVNIQCACVLGRHIKLQACVSLEVFTHLCFLDVGWRLHHLAVAGLAGCQQASSLCGKWPVGNGVFVPSLHNDKSEQDKLVFFTPLSPMFYWLLLFFTAMSIFSHHVCKEIIPYREWGLFAKHVIFSDIMFVFNKKTKCRTSTKDLQLVFLLEENRAS